MSYSSKVMGTRYVIQLELEHSQWFIKLMMDGVVEDRIHLTSVSEMGLINSIDQLMDSIQLDMNPIQLQQIRQNFVKKTQHLFTKADYDSKPTTPLKSAKKILTEPLPQEEEELRGGSYRLQQRLVNEYRKKLGPEDKVEVREIDIPQLQRSEDDSTQIQQLVESHQHMQMTLKELDKRIASLEKLTMKLVEITEMILVTE